eukprot:GHVU01148105.1.p3 GENE.GHVU01148105.1~~GHVU01148105.1.p3  ORF type:complete len:108 (+),score=8.95 GHVU01148105.1:3962-4285(+)
MGGFNVSIRFSSISESCGESLEELFITELNEFAGEVRGGLRRLRVVKLRGKDAITWFSLMSERCAPMLETLDIQKMVAEYIVCMETDMRLRRLLNRDCNRVTATAGR